MTTGPAIDPAYGLTLVCVMLAWLAYAGAFFIRRVRGKSVRREERNRSFWGVLLVGLGFGLVWGVRRPEGTAVLDLGAPAVLMLDAFAVALAAGSALLTLAAIRTLGRQWNIRAALVEGHTLITMGPYRIVRHPIYVAMIGMLVATGLALSRWPALSLGLVLAIAGTMVRVREEESLLRAAFGAQFETYRRAVPAFLPRFR